MNENETKSLIISYLVIIDSFVLELCSLHSLLNPQFSDTFKFRRVLLNEIIWSTRVISPSWFQVAFRRANERSLKLSNPEIERTTWNQNHKLTAFLLTFWTFIQAVDFFFFLKLNVYPSLFREFYIVFIICTVHLLYWNNFRWMLFCAKKEDQMST